ncbi:TIGR01777 family protein [Longibacter salinarum]|uniref:TIGR01777 family protein n=1 Tax=Longibacter salinarum TaxID=1850348 RepID=A0A2A8CYG8_9BACT|nr:TIGR01777 family oxidoreductase [Longibacter salinarum]PEN13644.1 TIGR01777 family protein [Longibacter salinarum]
MAMTTLRFDSEMPVSAGQLFDWHARPGAFQRLVPPWAPVRLQSYEGIREGDRAVIRVGPGPFSMKWVAEHYDVVEGRQFCDRQVSGPFAHWDHTHRMEPLSEDTSRLVDEIEFALPAGPIGSQVGRWFAEPELRRQFAYRHRVTRRDLELHNKYNPEGRSLTVAVSGASGLVGSALSAMLTTGGHTVVPLVRRGPASDDEILWDPRGGRIESEKFNRVDAVIHLAGENVFGLWTEDKKSRILTSRAVGTRLLAEGITDCENPPEVLISASAIGYYGDHGTDVITEESEPRNPGFLTEVCEAWESAADPAREAGIRVVHPRMGVILTPAGGALQLMLPAFQLGLGGRVGARDQYFPWVTLDDVIGALYHSVWSDDLVGPVNITAPDPARMEMFTETLAGVVNRPAFFNPPTPIVRTLGGEMAEEMLLKSARVLPKQLLDSEYTFAFDDLEMGLRHLTGRTKEPAGLA